MDGEWFPPGTTRQQVAYIKSFDKDREITAIAFGSQHYPEDLSLYYPGFEVFLVKDLGPTVGGIEDGPASNAGVKYGDVLVSIDGTPVPKKSADALEKLLSSHEPRRLSLAISRLGTTRKFEFALERADRVLAKNGLQIIHGKKFPAAIDAAELECAFRISK